MNDMTLYWIWLQQCLGEGAKTDNITGYFSNAKELYLAGEKERRLSGVFTAKQLEKLNRKSLSDAQKILKSCEDLGCGIIGCDDERYPELLRQIPDFPLVLYTMGDVSCLNNSVTISIVGTRRASDSGLDIAGKLASSLCRAGTVVVSGGAYGIDSAAHLGAVLSKGKTVAVLGCGFNAKYKDGIVDIKRDILERGGLVSEYHPDVEARGYNFPVRNRIISALSLGTVVVEAANKSGSLITADLASRQGRDVFAVPGNSANLGQMGTVSLIRDGAIPVFSAYDVLSQYTATHARQIMWDKVEKDLLYEMKKQPDYSIIKYGNKKNTEKEKPPEKNSEEAELVLTQNAREIKSKEKAQQKKEEEKPPVSEEEISLLSPNAKKILKIFEDRELRVDDICEKTMLPMSKILSSLTELEISGIIKSQPGHIYRMAKKTK